MNKKQNVVKAIVMPLLLSLSMACNIDVGGVSGNADVNTPPPSDQNATGNDVLVAAKVVVITGTLKDKESQPMPDATLKVAGATILSNKISAKFPLRLVRAEGDIVAKTDAQGKYELKIPVKDDQVDKKVEYKIGVTDKNGQDLGGFSVAVDQKDGATSGYKASENAQFDASDIKAEVKTVDPNQDPADQPDAPAPTDDGIKIVSSLPGMGAADVPLDKPIVIEFNKDLDPASISPENIQIIENGQPLPAQEIWSQLVRYENKKLFFNIGPEFVTLEPESQYIIKLGTGIKDVDGKNLPQPFELTFSTGKPLINKQPPCPEQQNPESCFGTMGCMWDEAMSICVMDPDMVGFECYTTPDEPTCTSMEQCAWLKIGTEDIGCITQTDLAEMGCYGIGDEVSCTANAECNWFVGEFGDVFCHDASHDTSCWNFQDADSCWAMDGCDWYMEEGEEWCDAIANRNFCWDIVDPAECDSEIDCAWKDDPDTGVGSCEIAYEYNPCDGYVDEAQCMGDTENACWWDPSVNACF